mmetsp:Transcript_90489/g.135610  ORF Transcript_90489/g.135610 Transcript_90489/m.135610 type:complete len:83 (+) Transcript_90489:327-575(+)
MVERGDAKRMMTTTLHRMPRMLVRVVKSSIIAQKNPTPIHRDRKKRHKISILRRTPKSGVRAYPVKQKKNPISTFDTFAAKI